MSQYEFTVSLRIRHPMIDPRAITELPRIQPQHTRRAGQPRCDAAGAELGCAHHNSYWMSRLMAEPQLSRSNVSVERVISQTLSHMRRVQPFLERLNDEGGIAELLASLYARDVFRPELPPDALALLGRLLLAVARDVHPHSPINATASRAN